MEARLAKVEAAVEHIQKDVADLKTDLRGLTTMTGTKIDGLRDVHDRDFRITFGALIFVALGLAALIAKGFKWF